ncbi:MAG: hypothetical protein Q4P71_06470 [Actinomycetaceae bacterium]|nr:hypothetical protein [Actinomycetaceae bacterium]
MTQNTEECEDALDSNNPDNEQASQTQTESGDTKATDDGSTQNSFAAKWKGPLISGAIGVLAALTVIALIVAYFHWPSISASIGQGHGDESDAHSLIRSKQSPRIVPAAELLEIRKRSPNADKILAYKESYYDPPYEGTVELYAKAEDVGATLTVAYLTLEKTETRTVEEYKTIVEHLDPGQEWSKTVDAQTKADVYWIINVRPDDNNFDGTMRCKTTFNSEVINSDNSRYNVRCAISDHIIDEGLGRGDQ